MEFNFYKNKKSDKVYWVDNLDSVGQHLFSFDKQTVFNLFYRLLAQLDHRTTRNL